MKGFQNERFLDIPKYIKEAENVFSKGRKRYSKKSENSFEMFECILDSNPQSRINTS